MEKMSSQVFKKQPNRPCINCGRQRISERIIIKTVDETIELCKGCYFYRTCHWKDPESQKRCSVLSIDPIAKKSKTPLCEEHHKAFLTNSSERECKFKSDCKNPGCIFKH